MPSRTVIPDAYGEEMNWRPLRSAGPPIPCAANRCSDAASPTSESVSPDPSNRTPQSSASWHSLRESVRPPDRCTFATATSIASSLTNVARSVGWRRLSSNATGRERRP